MYKKPNGAHLVIIYIFWFFLYVFFVLSGVIEFSLWGQVDYLWRAGAGLEIFFSHPHGPRYALVYPVYVISSATAISADRLFSLVVGGMIMGSGYLLARVSQIVAGKSLDFFWFSLAIISVFLGVLSFYMNGRIAFSILGFSLVLAAAVRWENEDAGGWHLLFAFCSGLFLSSVSSGTFLVVLSFVLFWAVHEAIFFNRRRRSRVVISVAILLFVLASAPFSWVFITKNLSYFGGGVPAIAAMTSHGLGGVIDVVSVFSLMLFIVLSVSLSVIGFVALHMFSRAKAILISLGFSAASGLFGYSAMAIGVAPLSVICVLATASAATQVALADRHGHAQRRLDGKFRP